MRGPVNRWLVSRLGRAASSFWGLVLVPVIVARAVFGAVAGAAGGLAGALAVALSLAIVIPVIALVLGIVFVVVPLVLAVATVAAIIAVLTWPLRRALWRYRRERAYRRWFYGLDDPGEVERPWRD